ncbi:putative bifunctional diguanylate cyclase/phosphodiesterase [Marinobacterium halophilum]|uniref:putative bifunctional diguanylate cyclase/phosphodiesterase n=1 Tax=Marinobacterium halophilum TaxID=267374 RepID=UPI000D0CAF62|nr:EAL domain-containing protein [Marinobacterium halophilum]
MTSPQVGVALFALLLLVAVWLFTLLQLHERREQTLDTQAVALSNLSFTVAENLEQVLDRARTLRALIHDKGGLSPVTQTTDMAALMLADSVFSRLSLYDHDGNLVYTTGSGSRQRLDLDLLAAEGGRQPSVLRALPQVAMDEVGSLPLLLPAGTAEQGCCHLLLDLNLGYLLNLYQRLDLGEQASIQILTDRGDTLVQVERGGLVRSEGHFDNSLILRSRLHEGHFSAVDLTNSQVFMSLFHRLNAFPFVVVMRQAEHEVLALYREQRAEHILIVLLLSLVVVIGLVWLLWMMHGREEQLCALERSEQRNQALLNTLRLEHQQTLEAASRDPLTGLYNRRLFLELAHSHLLGSKRQGRFTAVCFIDLDRFKAINDTLGHKVGDRLLQAVAERLTSLLRETDIVSRFGGDEFVLMLTGVKQRADIEEKVGQLVRELSAPYAALQGSALSTSPSIGVALSPQDGMDIETLVKHADMAMYKAKQSGRGQYALFDTAFNAPDADAAHLARLLPAAMAAGQIQVHLQPRVALPGYEPTGFEALVRWNSPEFGLLPPAQWLPVAESLALMPDLTEWVLERVCHQLQQWRTEAVSVLPVAINLSLSQLQVPALAQQLDAVITQYDIDPAWLELEIREQDLETLQTEQIAMLQGLQQRGIGLTLDDFGSRGVSLDQIHRLPFSRIKLDPSFLRDIRNSFDDNILLSATISLAKKLQLQVAAKGVETPDQLVYLKLAGCDEVQGHLFSRALSVEEVRHYRQHPGQVVYG